MSSDEKVTELTALATTPASGDLVPIVDVSDTTDSVNGTTKKITVTNLLSGVSASVGDGDYGDITVSATGTVWTIDNLAVTNAKIANSTIDLTSKVTGSLPAANGGTGRASHTAYAVLCGGTTTTAAQQSVSGVGTSGQVLTSNGASALPTWQDAAGGSESSGTFTPSFTSSNGDMTSSSYTTASGRYRKNGTTVHYRIELVITAANYSAGTGQLRVAGLPFTVDSSWSNVISNPPSTMTGMGTVTQAASSLRPVNGQTYGTIYTDISSVSNAASVSSTIQFTITGWYVASS